MGCRKKYSGLESSLVVVCLIAFVVAVVLIALLATGEPGTCRSVKAEVPFAADCPSSVPNGDRINCFPDGGATLKKCEERGCCWKPIEDRNVPWCFFSKNQGYTAQNNQVKTRAGFQVHLKRMPSPFPFGNVVENLVLTGEEQTENRFRFKITDSSKRRFEVDHENIKPFTGKAVSNPNYEVSVNQNPFGIKITRKSTKTVLFDTSVGPLQFADQFIQITAKLPTHNIYGLGEHVHKQYRHDTYWKTWPIFARDAFPNGNMDNLYGHHTFFMCLEEESGLSFGVFLLNSNAMEVELQPTPAITYRTIGGVLDFYIFLGSSPEHVVQEYLTLVGKPMMPAYWILGFQLSRWGYKDLDEVLATVERNRKIDLPYDTQIIDIDYMENKKDFTYDKVNFKNLPSFADNLHDNGQKFILILDPAISTEKLINGPYETYDRGTKMGVWINESDGKTPIVGEVWPGETVFPDYTNPQCIKWWLDECERFYKEVKFDGIWIDMNEVSSFKQGSKKGCNSNQWNHPPFIPRIVDNVMYFKTVCMDAKQTAGIHYDVHSLYGHSMTLATEEVIKKIFPNKRSAILSRSTFAGSGKYTGHWLGDNGANWNDMKWAIPGMLEFNLFGFPYIGADICGFFGNADEDLCSRWMQVGAFYPFSRNHNAEGYKPQDPAFFGETSLLVNTSRHYLNIRYTLLPYLYTLFHEAHVNGSTVVRSLLHEFPSDNQTWTVDRQFLWGPALLISPVLDPTIINLYGGSIFSQKQWVTLQLPEDKLGLHVRGGFVFPTQQPANSTFYSRKNPMGLLIALDEQGRAEGRLFWDDGESRDTFEKEQYISYRFSVAQDVLKLEVLKNGYKDPNNLQFEEITILGLQYLPRNVTVKKGADEIVIPESDIDYDKSTKVTLIKGLQLVLGEAYTVEWKSTPRDVEKINCNPEGYITEEACKNRGCQWDELPHKSEVPSCFYPYDYGYQIDSSYGIVKSQARMSTQVKRNTKYPERFKGQTPTIEVLKIEVTSLNQHMLNFKIFDPKEKRYEVPIPLNIPNVPANETFEQLYDVQLTYNPFGIMVKRKSSNAVIWNSQVGGFTFTDQFIQISTSLPSENIYGLGETEHSSFKLDLNWNTWGMFAKDQPPGHQLNSYGSHPFYMCLENDANAHGVFLFNSNAMDVTLQEAPTLTYRILGGILDFYVFLGPTPEMVVQQYTELIGRPVLPPYWSLGFQLCQYGYKNIEEVATLYKNMKKARIPYDVQYFDIDYMERQLDFTIDKDDFATMPQLVNEMKAERMRIVIILDPAISGNETVPYKAFTSGLDNDVYIKWKNSSDIVWGKVWPDFPNVTVDSSKDWDYQVKHYRSFAAFPDFFRNETKEWWFAAIKEFYDNPDNPSASVKFDGLWIDMNEPASFVHGSVNDCKDEKLNNPPYMPDLESRSMGLNHKTLCMESEQILPDGTSVRHYDVHNLYGWSQTQTTLDSLQKVTGERGLVVTRSTFPTSGQWSGHWLGDNTASWDQMHKSIIGMMEFSLFGISYTGADICGFFQNTTYELCLRWSLLGAFYPYSRNHNSIGTRPQDPTSWDETFENHTRNVLETRYMLLPYLYTLLYDAHVSGSTVIRPLLHEFYADKSTWDIDEQFLWGAAIMITPVLKMGATNVTGYIPNTRWYDFKTKKEINVRGKWLEMPTPLEHINLHVRGGYVIPWQSPANNTYYSRKEYMGLFVALDDNSQAEGHIFWDDGQTIDSVAKEEYFLGTFSVKQNVLTTAIKQNHIKSTASELKLAVVEVWGIENTPIASVTAHYNGTDHQINDFSVTEQTLIIQMVKNDFYIDQPLRITWKTT
uniref:alpha-glucosidase n=1 Tax=Callorhinchus milii TaxID=7868 RepID=A0A4W3K2V3_CALMI